MSDQDETYEITAEHIAHAVMEDDEGLKKLGSMLNEDQQELLVQCAGRLVAIGIHTAQGLASGPNSKEPLHDLGIYLQGAAEANDMKKEG